MPPCAAAPLPQTAPHDSAATAAAPQCVASYSLPQAFIPHVPRQANGVDAALVRASVLDRAGNIVHNAANPISFAVKSGSGRLVGTHNGQVDSRESSAQPTVAAYHGLARAVVMVTSVAALPAFERELLAAIDLDSMVTGLKGGDEPGAVAGIVVQASSPGLGVVELTIPVSTDAVADSVLAVAATAAGQRVEF